VATPDLLRRTDRGLYCPAGDFYIDPWEPVDRAVITHAHADHARPGSRHYLTARAGEQVLRLRVGHDATVQSIPYGEAFTLNGVRVSLHPAGHILGSAQVRLESRGEVWVVSGDYKLQPDPTCEPFEPVRCHTYVTESTFGLPIYRWPAPGEVLAEVHAWWRGNQDAGKASLLFGYALGKAQRLLGSLDPSIGPVYTHGAVEKVNAAYRACGVALLGAVPVATAASNTSWDRALIVGPPSAHGSPWARKFGHASTAFASGWMRIRGTRRRRAIDRGFVLSDHADWPGLLDAVRATGAQRVWVTHGYTLVLARWFREQGLDADVVQTRFEGERDEAPGDTPAEEGER
jgi:putative mRNA 3-end processing factor